MLGEHGERRGISPDLGSKTLNLKHAVLSDTKLVIAVWLSHSIMQHSESPRQHKITYYVRGRSWLSEKLPKIAEKPNKRASEPRSDGLGNQQTDSGKSRLLYHTSIRSSVCYSIFFLRRRETPSCIYYYVYHPFCENGIEQRSLTAGFIM